MAEPKKKLSKTRTHSRRANYKVELPQVTLCPNCKKAIRAHTVCKYCGVYNKKQIINATPVKRISTDDSKILND